MENAVSMHVINRFNELVHVILDSIFWEITASTLDSVIHVHIHQLEDQGQSPCRLIVEHFIKLDNLRMWGQSSQGLNFSQVVNL